MSNNFDDDLFEYDPEVESSPTHSHQETVTPLSKEEKSFFDNIKDNLDEDIESSGNINGANVAFADSFQVTLYNFIDSQVRNSSFFKSVTQSLDEITSGRFSLIHYKNHLEITISRTMHVLYLTSFLSQDDPLENSSDKIKDLLDLLNLNFNTFYLKTCFHSTFAIMQHKLFLDRQLYIAACNELNQEVHQSLFMEPSDFVESEYADHFESSTYHQDKFSKINSYLYESTDLVKNISSILGKDVSF
jgi:hypothetical protein